MLNYLKAHPGVHQEFALRIFQEPAGSDLAGLTGRAEPRATAERAADGAADRTYESTEGTTA